jgi:hypothetical protein
MDPFEYKVLRWDVLPGWIGAPKSVAVRDIPRYNYLAFEENRPEQDHNTQTQQSQYEDKAPPREIGVMLSHCPLLLRVSCSQC